VIILVGQVLLILVVISAARARRDKVTWTLQQLRNRMAFDGWSNRWISPTRAGSGAARLPDGYS
jgi:hypothetical protein